MTGSPYTISVHENSMVEVKGRGIESVPVNQPTEFVIDASKAAFPANPVVSITGLYTIYSVSQKRPTIFVVCL